MILIGIFSGINAFLFYVLSDRILTAEHDVATTWNDSTETALGQVLKEYCLSVVSDDLLPMAIRPGIKTIPLRFRDHYDTFMTVGDLIKDMAVVCKYDSYENRLKLIQMFYKLDYTLNPSPNSNKHVLVLLEDLLRKNDGTKEIGTIERIKSGQRCDNQTMTPIRFGSHVEHPLNFIVFSMDKKIIHKAEVLCR